jgi:hypothetical protein
VGNSLGFFRREGRRARPWGAGREEGTGQRGRSLAWLDWLDSKLNEEASSPSRSVTTTGAGCAARPGTRVGCFACVLCLRAWVCA